jgi:hypothetical protein
MILPVIRLDAVSDDFLSVYKGNTLFSTGGIHCYARSVRLSTRTIASLFFIAATSFAQNLTEFGAVAAGSAIGGAGGKPVSDSITAIFGKVDHQAAKAAAKEPKEKQTEAASLKVAPGMPASDPGGVPLPPEPRKRAAAPSLPIAQMTVPEEALQTLTLADVAPVLPPPLVMSPEDFRSVSNGMTRADVLKFGAPAGKITMFEDGHLVEVYSYRQNGEKIGTLRLTDGAVSSIQ